MHNFMCYTLALCALCFYNICLLSFFVFQKVLQYTGWGPTHPYAQFMKEVHDLFIATIREKADKDGDGELFCIVLYCSLLYCNVLSYIAFYHELHPEFRC